MAGSMDLSPAKWEKRTRVLWLYCCISGCSAQHFLSAALISIFTGRIKVSSVSVVLLWPQLVTGNWSQVSGHEPLTCTALFFLYTAEGPLLLRTASLAYIFSDKEKEAINYFKGARIRNTLPPLHGHSPLKQHKLTPVNKSKIRPTKFYFNYEPLSLEAKPNKAHTDLFSLQPVISFLKRVDLSLPRYYLSELSASVLVCLQPTSLDDPVVLSGGTIVLRSFYQFSWT